MWYSGTSRPLPSWSRFELCGGERARKSFNGQPAAGVNRLANKASVLRRDQVAGSMGAYADFAARMRGADSNRSQRSARSYRG